MRHEDRKAGVTLPQPNMEPENGTVKTMEFLEGLIWGFMSVWEM